VFDMALGVLLALTETDPSTVESELMSVARQGRVDVFHLAAALVGLACGLPSAEARAFTLVVEHWGPQLTHRCGCGEYPDPARSLARP
jgi:hypothetical protein